MPVYQYEHRMEIDRPLKELWAFFSRPENLAPLSPPAAGVRVLSPAAGSPMYEGMVVQLRMGTGWMPRLHWHSVISHIEEGVYFIDEQVSGPFSLWHHEHHFRAISPSRTEVRDLLYYKPPLGPLGALADRLVIGRQLRRLFDYREQAIRNLFA